MTTRLKPGQRCPIHGITDTVSQIRELDTDSKVCFVLLMIAAGVLGAGLCLVRRGMPPTFTFDQPETICIGLVDKDGGEAPTQCFHFADAPEAVSYRIYLNPAKLTREKGLATP